MMMCAMPVAIYAQLLAGTSGPGKGTIYAYQGGTNWTAISPPLGDAVLDIIQFEGALYAATMSADLGGEVWQYDGGTSWTVVGINMDEEVCNLKIYNGQLYAGTAQNDGNLYLYNGASFVYMGTVANFFGIRAMYASSYGYLQLGDIESDVFGHYDGTISIPTLTLATVASLTLPSTTTSYMPGRRNAPTSTVPPMASTGRWFSAVPTALTHCGNWSRSKVSCTWAMAMGSLATWTPRKPGTAS